MNSKLLFGAALLIALLFAAYVALSEVGRGSLPYFAYGANLDPSTLKARAGGFVGAQSAKLVGYRMVFQTNSFSAFGVANLEPGAGGQVAGALYRLSDGQVDALDNEQGVPSFYRRQEVEVLLADGSEERAFTYVLAGEAILRAPSRPYVLAASKGLNAFGYGQQEQYELAQAAK